MCAYPAEYALLHRQFMFAFTQPVCVARGMMNVSVLAGCYLVVDGSIIDQVCNPLYNCTEGCIQRGGITEGAVHFFAFQCVIRLPSIFKVQL